MKAADPGLRFAAALSFLSRTPEGKARQLAAVDAAVRSGLGPDDLIALLQRHRTQSIAMSVLTEFGRTDILGPRLDELRREDAESRQRGLILAMRGGRARQSLVAAGIPCLEFKGGPTLSRKLYGDVAVRSCADMDLMVPLDRVFDAEDVLVKDGWESSIHPVWRSTPHHRWMARLALWDSAFVDSRLGCKIELHSRFEFYPAPRQEALWWEAMEDSKSREIVPAEFLYLVLHGTKHLWERMKWLGDIAAIVELKPEIVEASLPLARRLDLMACLGTLAPLLEDLYGFELPLPASSRNRRRDERFAKFCLASLAGPDPARFKPMEAVVSWLRKKFAHQPILSRRTSKLSRLGYFGFWLLVRPQDVEAWGPLPRYWIPLFPLMRLRSFVRRYTKYFLSRIRDRWKQ